MAPRLTAPANAQAAPRRRHQWAILGLAVGMVCGAMLLRHRGPARAEPGKPVAAHREPPSAPDAVSTASAAVESPNTDRTQAAAERADPPAPTLPNKFEMAKFAQPARPEYLKPTPADARPPRESDAPSVAPVPAGRDQQMTAALLKADSSLTEATEASPNARPATGEAE